MDLRETVRTSKLGNGLELIVLPMPFTPVAAVLTCVRAGSVLEREGARGLSHFIEHMLFKGTRRFSGSRFWGIIQGYGGWANAYTARDYTCYHELLPAGGVRAAIELEGDRHSNPVFDPDEVARERTVILEERRTSSLESAAGFLDEAHMLQAFPSHPYRNPIVGYAPDISSFDSGSTQAFHSEFYNPGNMVVAVAGNVDPAEVEDAVEAAFGSMEPGGRVPYPVEDSPWGAPGRTSVSHPSEIPRLTVSFPAPPAGHPDAPLLEMACYRLSGTRTSMLDELLVHGGLALSVSADTMSSACPGLLQVRTSLYPGSDARQVEELVMEEIRRLTGTTVPEEDFENLRVQFEMTDLSAHSSPTGAAGLLSIPLLVSGNMFLAGESSRRIQAATPAELREACLRWLDPERAFITELVPSGSGREAVDFATDGGAGDIAPPDSIDILEADIPPEMLRVPSRSVSSGTVTERLANGLTVLMKRDDTFPLVSIGLSTPMAVGMDPPGMAGLAAVTTETMSYGTESEDYVVFNRRLERIGARFAHEADQDFTFGAMSIRPGDIREGLAYLSDLFRRPAFRKADLDRVVAEKIAELGHRAETPFGAAFERLSFEMSEPREAAAVPTRESLSRIGRDDAVSFHADCSRPSGAFLVAVGAFDENDLMSEVEAALGDWRDPVTEPRRFNIAAVPKRGTRVRTVMEDRTQTVVLLATEAPVRDSEQFHAFRLLSAILGGGMNSRLENRIREQHGMAYHVGCEHLATARQGRFMAYFATAEENADRALEILEQELDGARSEPFDGRTLDLFKASAVGRKAMNLHDYDSLASYLLFSASTGRPLDSDVSSAAATLAVTPEMVRRAAGDWLAPASRFVSMAGSAG
ncbi:MAG TPA: pitrilysin family protein [Candidatus Fermentibacter daniensis]|nr:pitrilysin family protein [Candidatus Fermentibacter daniensis]